MVSEGLRLGFGFSFDGSSPPLGDKGGFVSFFSPVLSFPVVTLLSWFDRDKPVTGFEC